MDHQKISCILPSNAPALPGHLHDSAIPNRVLQERCNNRQDDLSDSDPTYRKGEPLSREDTAFFNDIRLNPPIDARTNRARPPAEIARSANTLWHRLLNCKPYTKYRERQPKATGPSQEVKWPEQMEIAFCRALIYFPPIGRRKLPCSTDNKPRGRNELIAEKIEKWTGESRTRKQVSSHIQVLKPMVKDDPKIMEHLAGDEKSSRPRGRHERGMSSVYRRAYHPSMTQHQRYMPHNMVSSRRSNVHSAIPSFNMLNTSVPKPHANTHMPAQFEMFVRLNDTANSSPPLHCFTTLREHGSKLADIQTSDPQLLFQKLPQLSSIDLNDLCNTQIVLAESTIKIMSGSLPKNAELGIQFELQTQSYYDLRHYTQFECSTQFYHNGQPLNDPTLGPIDYDARYNRLGNVQFGSSFWAMRVMDIARRLRDAQEYKKKAQMCDDEADAIATDELARKIELEIRVRFERLTAMQELSAKEKITGRKVTLLFVCWKFEQTRHDARGETTWRNVVLHSPRQVAKHEDLLMKNEYEQMALSLSQHNDAVMTLDAPFEAHSTFDLNDPLSSLAMAGLPDDSNGPAQMYSSNDVDFTGGHILMSLAPDVSMASAVSMNGFHDAVTASLYDPSQSQAQAWQQYSNPYFDHSNDYSQLRSLEADNVHGSAAYDSTNGGAAVEPFDANAGAHHSATPFDGNTGHNSFHTNGDHDFAEAGASHHHHHHHHHHHEGVGNQEEVLPSIEFMGPV